VTQTADMPTTATGRYAGGLWRAGVAGCVALAAVAGPTGASLGQLNQERAKPIQGMDVSQNLGQTIDLTRTMRDWTGAEVPLGKFFGQDGRPVWVAMVYFRCPAACPQIMNSIRAAISTLSDGPGWRVGEKYNIVLVTFDPTEQREAVAAKRKEFLAGALAPGADESSLDTSLAVLYADAGTVRALADELGFPYRYMPESGEFSHASATMVLSAEGKIMRYLEGSVVPPQTVRLALLEASEGRVGSIIERWMAFCFHWNPQTGSYSLSAWRLMQIGATLSAVIVGGLVLRGVIVERRRRRARLAAAGLGGSGGVDGSGGAGGGGSSLLGGSV
jgi:protein SCO1/2